MNDITADSFTNDVIVTKHEWLNDLQKFSMTVPVDRACIAICTALLWQLRANMTTDDLLIVLHIRTLSLKGQYFRTTWVHEWQKTFWILMHQELTEMAAVQNGTPTCAKL